MAKFYENDVRYAGLLGRDSDPKVLESGDAFCANSLAVQKSWKDKQGEWHSRTTWIRIKAFGYAAEKLGKCLKGANIYIKGETEDSKWMKDGEEVVTQEVICRSVQIIPMDEKKPAATVGNGADRLVGDDDAEMPY